MTRTGKIARLPRSIRDELNTRLSDGEQGLRLVEWLNGHPEVQEVLEDYFDGRPITDGNLSEWKKGGYEDWLQHQKSLEWARLAADEAEELEEDGEGVPLSDRLAPHGAVAVAQMIRGARTKPPETAQERRELLHAVEVLTALRVADHRAARLRMDLTRWAEESRTMEKEAQHRQLWDMIKYSQDVERRETFIRMQTAEMTPEKAQQYRDFVNMELYPPGFRAPRVTVAPAAEVNGAQSSDPSMGPSAESGGIRLNPARSDQIRPL